MTTVNNNINGGESSLINSAVVICTSSLVQKLSQARLPPNYIGTRRVVTARPPKITATQQQSSNSSLATTATKSVEENNGSGPKRSSIVFKVTNPDGTERRMTRQEKKALRQKVAEEKKLARLAMEEVEKEEHSKKRKQTKEVQSNNEEEAMVQESSKQKMGANENNISNPSALPSSTATATLNTVDDITIKANGNVRYHQLSVNTTAMEQELAEFRGDRREDLPPVMLSPPMSLCASHVLATPSSNDEFIASTDPPTQERHSRNWIQYDPALSKEWARLLKESMLPAETVRQAEDLRPMAYQLTPEVWTRMRPAGDHLEKKLPTKVNSSIFHPTRSSAETPGLPMARTTISNNSWLTATCRPPSALDVAVAVIFDYLYQNTSLHVSCGAKFGADFLVYDGPRSERHAFAGMRVLLPKKVINEKEGGSTSILPLPSAYDMAGYVRCLNTAGKLALLATVVEESSPTEETESISSSSKQILYRIAIVDVALEKILTAPTHQKRARTEKRRDVSRNLAKRK